MSFDEKQRVWEVVRMRRILEARYDKIFVLAWVETKVNRQDSTIFQNFQRLVGKILIVVGKQAGGSL